MKITKTNKWLFSLAGGYIITVVSRYLKLFGDDVINITEQVNISSNALAILLGIFSAYIFFRVLEHLKQTQEKTNNEIDE